MGAKSKIEWTDATWNPVTGCTKVSEGCRNCYAERFAERFGAKVHGWEGLSNIDRSDASELHFCKPAVFSQVICHPDRLDQPFHWRKPRRVFVCSMGDLFHEDVPDEFVYEILDRIAMAANHTFMVLTKRPINMKYLIHSWLDGCDPLVNLWLGVSVEDQKASGERIPRLLQTPAAVRFVSCEPLLGHVNLRSYFPMIHWVICGGETGPKARYMNPAYARSLRDQCKDAGIPFFMKQMSRKQPIPEDLMIREYPSP